MVRMIQTSSRPGHHLARPPFIVAIDLDAGRSDAHQPVPLERSVGSRVADLQAQPQFEWLRLIRKSGESAGNIEFQILSGGDRTGQNGHRIDHPSDVTIDPDDVIDLQSERHDRRLIGWIQKGGAG